MARDPFYIFVDFITCNNTIADLSRRCDQMTHQIYELDERITAARNQRDHAHAHYEHLYKQQHKQEIEASDVADQLRSKRDQLARTMKPKEYLSLQHDIDKLQQQKQSLDDAVVDIWQQVEDALAAYQEAHRQYQGTYENCASDKQQVEQQLQEYRDTIAAYERQQEELRQHVRQEWLDAFDRKRQHVSDPAVLVEHNVCSACFSTIPRNELKKLERHVIVACPSCYRLLYMV